MRRQRPALGVPILSMVDAFVGAVAVIMIMVIISSPRSDETAQVPRPDMIIRCGADGGAALEDGRPVDHDTVVEAVAGADYADALSINVRIEAPNAALACAVGLERALHDANDGTATAPGALPIVLTQLVMVEKSDAR